MDLSFDHLVLSVHNLDQAVADFEKLGFTVTPGGKHYGGISKNALIFFKDGSFLELITLNQNIKVSILRFLNKFQWGKKWQYSPKYGLAYKFYQRCIELPEGIIDYCLISEKPADTYRAIESQGIFMTKPLEAGRKKPDGSKVAWEMFTPFIADLPFIRSPFQPFIPVPEEYTVHANGCLGIHTIHHMALDFKECSLQYERLLRKAPTEKTDLSASFGLQEGCKIKVYRSSKHPDLQEQFKGKGIGLFGIGLNHMDTNKYPWDSKLSHGMVILED